MKSRQEYIEQLKLTLDEWNAKIDDMEVQAHLAEMKNRESYESEIARLREKRDNLKNTINNMSESTEQAFEELLLGAEQAREAIVDAYNRAKSRFNW